MGTVSAAETKNPRAGGGDDCKTVWMHLMSLDYILKMVRMVNFILHIFYHNF